MKSTFVLLTAAFTFTVYPQFNGMVIENVPYRQNEHFLFSLNSDTIINGSWTQIANYPRALFGVNSYWWQASGKIFTCGGATVQGIPQKDCYYYNPVSNGYEPADSLPVGRWTGKLVRVKDSLYLVGSSNNFASPDGLLFKYSPSQNHWVIKDTMPAPYLHESAVCVFKDTLIICIGGSSGAFSGNTNTVRIYNPYKNKWRTMDPFPLSTTTGHAECRWEDSSIIVVGGYGTTSSFINTIYRGKINEYHFDDGVDPDTIGIEWTPVALHDTTIFRTGVYRVGGGRAGDWMLFGPALRNAATYNTVYAVNFSSINDTLRMFWYRMIPNVPDSAGGRPTIAVKYMTDSAQIFLFAGQVGLSAVQSAYKYSFPVPVPIGIKHVSGNIPDEIKLYQNYPNPFNPSTTIEFSISKQGNVKLYVYDITGRVVDVLVNEFKKPGNYSVNFKAENLSSGIYFYMLSSGEFRVAKKMLLVK